MQCKTRTHLKDQRHTWAIIAEGPSRPPGPDLTVGERAAVCTSCGTEATFTAGRLVTRTEWLSRNGLSDHR